ncbi:MAG: hypothetical protein P4L93_03315 [Coriobacteriia bacterium]|nr:hypothetical protein [Coriobacteriia bacterium]
MTVALRAIRLLFAFVAGLALELGALVTVWKPADLASRPRWVSFVRGDLPAVAIDGLLVFALLALILWGESAPLIPVAAFLLGCGLVLADAAPAFFHELRHPGAVGLTFVAVSLVRALVPPMIALALLSYKQRHRQTVRSGSADPVRSA